MRHIFPRFARFIENYRYYRKRGYQSKAAWYLANLTLPE
jgi:hypothetical protein